MRLALATLLALTCAAWGDDHRLVEKTHQAGEYFVQRSGTSWTYAMPKGGRARWAITAFVDWKASVSFSMGKRSGAAAWRVKDGAWLERTLARSDQEMVVLPAVIREGTRWQAPASFERGTQGTTQFEVLALDAAVDLPQGRVEHCLAVLETELDGSKPYTHYWAPNLGKVAVRGPDDWVLQLLQFTPGGGKAHGD